MKATITFRYLQEGLERGFYILEIDGTEISHHLPDSRFFLEKVLRLLYALPVSFYGDDCISINGYTFDIPPNSNSSSPEELLQEISLAIGEAICFFNAQAAERTEISFSHSYYVRNVRK